MSLNYKPIGNRVIVEAMNQDSGERKLGSIIVPETISLAHVDVGKVVACGDGEVAAQTGVKIPMTLKEGDTILFRKGGAFLPVNIDGKEYFLMREHDIECIIGE